MDADVVNEGQERCARAAFELRLMLGNGCVDFSKILGILETKAA
jgi:hypothetical protein